jgi:hypothetical protein
LGTPCVDPLASADSENVGLVDQPGWTLPGYDTIVGNWGGPFANASDKARMSPAITVGGGHIYVATDNPGAPYGPGLYVYSDGTGCTSTDKAALGTFCKVRQQGANWRPSGLTYYRGEVFAGWYTKPRTWPVTATLGEGQIDVYDADLAYKRTLPYTGNPGGFDVAWGEIWVRVQDVGWNLFGGLTVDYLEILDPQTGVLRGVQPITITPTPRATPFDLNAGGAQMAKDVAISPELGAISTGTYSFQRPSNYDITAPLGKLPGTDADPSCYPNLPDSWHPADSPLGAAAAWGMRWIIQVTDCPSWRGGQSWVQESALGSPNGVLTRVSPQREWQPHDYQTDTVRDVAYRSHEPTITWTGNPIRSDWQHGNQSLTYWVSDGDYYIVGKTLEHWLQPASGFQSATLTATPIDANGNPTGAPTTLATTNQWSGTLTINEDTALNSGTYALTMTASLTNGKKITKTNPNFHVDNSPPAGALNSIASYVKGTINVSGTMSDTHSGPRDWQLQMTGHGGLANWVGVPGCGTVSTPDPTSGTYGCQWDTKRVSDGTYDLRAQKRDLVTDAFGGSNVGATAPAIVTADNTPPTVSLSGGLKEHSDDAAPLHDDDPQTLNISATDPTAGVTSVQVQVDGVQIDNAPQSCAAGGCSESHSTTVQTSGLADGGHTVTVVTLDQAGNETDVSLPIDVENTPESYDDQNYNSDPSAAQVAAASGGGAATAPAPALARSSAGSARPSDLPSIGDPPGWDPSGAPPVSPNHLLPCPEANTPANFSVFSLGNSFEGLPLTAVFRRCDAPDPLAGGYRGNLVSFIYGDCTPVVANDNCPAPVEVQSWPACERNLSLYDPPITIPLNILPPPPQLTTVQGVPGALLEQGFRIEVYTADSTVAVFGVDLAQVSRAANAIRLEPPTFTPSAPVPPPVTVPGSLPQPVAGALTGTYTCTHTPRT